MVYGCVLEGAEGALRGLLGRQALAFGRATHPVRRLRGVAAAVVAGGGAGDTAWLLEAPAGRRPRTRAPHGSPPPTGPDPPGGTPIAHAARVVDRGAQRVEPAGGGDAVHDPACGLPGAALTLQRAEGHRGGLTDRGAQPGGDRGVDRLLCQHAGNAYGPLWRPHLQGAAGAGAGGVPGSL